MLTQEEKLAIIQFRAMTESEQDEVLNFLRSCGVHPPENINDFPLLVRQVMGELRLFNQR